MNLENAKSNLDAVIKENSERVLQKFGEVAVSGLTEPRLIAALEDVKKYWRDLNRPTLTFLSCQAVGGDLEVAENAALMFTLASSGFGIHDDIIDKSLNKHLRKTILRLHGSDIALLIGDLLIVKGWTVAQEIIRKSPNQLIALDALQVYGHLSVEICEAEYMETLCRKNVDTDLAHYEGILWKEMAETEACCRIGAMLGGGQAVDIEALSQFGRRIGFISRLTNEVEDCLNLKGDLSNRIQYESLPLPLLYAGKYSPKIRKKIERIVSKDKLAPNDVRALLESCFATEAFSYIRSIAGKSRADATLRLGCLKNSHAREALLYLLSEAYARIDRLCI